MTTSPTTLREGHPASAAPHGQLTMRAVVHDRYGSADVLRLETTQRPAIADDEVLIQVHAAGVDRGTEHLMTGRPYLVRLAGYGITKPKNRIPGLDVAGVVVEVGSAVTRFAKGDEVFGTAKGSFAEFARASQDSLAAKPAKLSFEQAAVVPVSGITALHALVDVGGVEAGQRVLVVGASGGVGTYAVQLARRSAPTSPAWRAPRRSRWSVRSVQITSSTTRRPTSPTAATSTTSWSTSEAEAVWPDFAGR